MSFNPDTSKQPQEIIFSRENKKIIHPLLRFNNSIVLQTPYQKDLGIFLSAWLIFKEHLKVITIKVNKTIALLQKSLKALPGSVLMTMDKAFVRLHLDYGVIYEEAYNETFHQNLQSIQYNSCITL